LTENDNTKLQANPAHDLRLAVENEPINAYNGTYR